MSFVLPSLVYQLGIGGVGGFVAGYAIKKISKFILVLVGLLVLLLIYLGTSGIISVNFEELWKALNNMFGFAGQIAGWLVGFISLLPSLGSFVAGFLLGLKLA